jgi:signal transduction histidine kinase
MTQACLDRGFPPAAARAVSAPAAHTATLDDVDITSELERRAHRAPDFAAEHGAVTALVAELARNPRNVLQRLAEVALGLCHADTAGVSLLEGDVFRWEAVAGVSASARGRTLPRHASPCGVCVDRDAVQLMRRPDRRFQALSGERPFFEALLVPFHDHGEPAGAVWLVHQNADRMFDGEDARVVGVLTLFASAAWQLWKAGDAAAHSGTQKDLFIATLGHELRNPLSVLTTAAAVLKVRAGTDDDVQRTVDMVERQCRHVSRLVDDLLDIARIESGKLELDVQPVDLRAIVTDTVEGRRAEVDRRRQVVTVQLANAPIVVHADPVRLVQVVSNLVDNAAKYTPDAGHIAIAVTSEGGDAVVVVQDDGAGIPTERLQSIFEPFVQLPGARGQTRGGMGLGLALVRRLTELHGGRIEVASDGLARGSRFTVRLPVQARVQWRQWQLPRGSQVAPLRRSQAMTVPRRSS